MTLPLISTAVALPMAISRSYQPEICLLGCGKRYFDCDTFIYIYGNNASKSLRLQRIYWLLWLIFLARCQVVGDICRICWSSIGCYYRHCRSNCGSDGFNFFACYVTQQLLSALATGTIAASGTLGQIIPPSIVLIILADQLGLQLIKQLYTKVLAQRGNR